MQILNGIDVSLASPQKTNGLLNSNINPKYFKLKNIDDINDIHLKKIKYKKYYKIIKDKWIHPKIM